MTARTDLLRAALNLAATGVSLFTPDELKQKARRDGSTHSENTLNTHISSWMCANAPANEATGVGEFIRLSPGLYKLNDEDRWPEGSRRLFSTSRQLRAPVESPEAQADDESAVSDLPTDWYWEGHVQSLVVSHLVSEGWSIRRVADTASSEHGHDIEAVRDSRVGKGPTRILVEVKGYPTSTYARGSRQGQPRTTGSVTTQARQYFSHALLSGLLMRAESGEDTLVALAFPAMETYRNLARRVGDVLFEAWINIWLVSEDGTVEDVGGL
jgi:hypothetical protein